MEEWRGMTAQQMGTMIHDWFKEDGFPIDDALVPNTDFSWSVTLSKKKSTYSSSRIRQIPLLYLVDCFLVKRRKFYSITLKLVIYSMS